ncbi:hypothetical protein H9P43_005222 [Blastocladiella emersonii ATCC 22665]|nr:hypothetical protein H9P43_005222 [Blastocladiella emersonii ATCC 22665]
MGHNDWFSNAAGIMALISVYRWDSSVFDVLTKDNFTLHTERLVDSFQINSTAVLALNRLADFRWPAPEATPILGWLIKNVWTGNRWLFDGKPLAWYLMQFPTAELLAYVIEQHPRYSSDSLHDPLISLVITSRLAAWCRIDTGIDALATLDDHDLMDETSWLVVLRAVLGMKEADRKSSPLVKLAVERLGRNQGTILVETDVLRFAKQYISANRELMRNLEFLASVQIVRRRSYESDDDEPAPFEGLSLRAALPGLAGLLN